MRSKTSTWFECKVRYEQMQENGNQKMAEQYNMEVDKLKELFGKNETAAMKGDYIAQKALHFVTDEAVEVAPKAEEEAPAEDSAE